MRKPILSLILILLTGAVFAGELGEAPPTFSPRSLDRTMVTAVDPTTGTAWSAWSYRFRGEYSLALSMRSPAGIWSDPIFIGLDDGLSQERPSMAVDASGNFYLAWLVRETGEIWMTAARAGQPAWFAGQVVSDEGLWAGGIELKAISDRIVLAYQERSSRDVGITHWANLMTRIIPGGIQEGPDGFPLPLKYVKGDEEEIPGDDRNTDRTPRSSGRIGSNGGGESH